MTVKDTTGQAQSTLSSRAKSQRGGSCALMPLAASGECRGNRESSGHLLGRESKSASVGGTSLIPLGCWSNWETICHSPNCFLYWWKQIAGQSLGRGVLLSPRHLPSALWGRKRLLLLDEVCLPPPPGLIPGSSIWPSHSIYYLSYPISHCLWAGLFSC